MKRAIVLVLHESYEMMGGGWESKLTGPLRAVHGEDDYY